MKSLEILILWYLLFLDKDLYANMEAGVPEWEYREIDISFWKKLLRENYELLPFLNGLHNKEILEDVLLLNKEKKRCDFSKFTNEIPEGFKLYIYVKKEKAEEHLKKYLERWKKDEIQSLSINEPKVDWQLNVFQKDIEKRLLKYSAKNLLIDEYMINFEVSLIPNILYLELIAET